MISCGESLSELLVQFKLKLFSAIPFISDRKKEAELQTRLRKDVLLSESNTGPEKEGINHIADIPEELLSNILIRLPTKFVSRCKLVCKQWASLISDPFFVSSYIFRFPTSPASSWTVVGEHVKDRCIEYDQPKHICTRQDFRTLCLSIDHERKANQIFKVLGANDGTIIFGLIYHGGITSYESCNLYYICNPEIRKLISLSPPSPNFQTVEWFWGSGLVTHVENGVLETFRVVLLVPDIKAECLRFRVYASETQEWNEYIVPSTIPSRHHVQETLPTAFNRILHWVAEDGLIIAYDPYADPPGRVRVIAPPDDAEEPKGGFVRFKCDASRGKLSYLERLAIAGIEVRVRLKLWVLEDYGSGVWRLSHESDDASIRFDRAVVSRSEIAKSTPMFFDPFDPDIVYLGLWICVLSYDVKTGKIEVVQDMDYTNGRKMNEMFPGYLAFSVEFFP